MTLSLSAASVQAWCTLLRGEMETAATMFGGLATATKSGYRKTFYTAFQVSTPPPGKMTRFAAEREFSLDRQLTSAAVAADLNMPSLFRETRLRTGA